MTEVTDYRWRQEFGGLKSDPVKRLKNLALLWHIFEEFVVFGIPGTRIA